MRKLLIAACAAALTTTPAIADDHGNPMDNLDPQTVEALVRYGMPLALDAVDANCAGELSPSGYYLSNRNGLAAKFAAGAEGSWPQARAAMMQIGGAEDGMAAIFEAMPDEALRPFMDAIFVQKIGEEIKPDMCGDIERGLELVDPMPAENMAALVGFIMELSQRDKGKKE